MVLSLDSSSICSRMHGRIWVDLLVFLLTSFHNRKHAKVDDSDTSGSKAVKVSGDDIEKAKMEWASVQFSDDEDIDDSE